MFPQLTTERFILGQVEASDLPFLLEGLSDPIAVPYYGIYFNSLDDTRAQLEWYTKNWNEGTGIHWKISSKGNRDFIGVISVYQYKAEHNKAELGYWILPRFWRQGIATEVLPPVMSYWQREKGLHRLEAFIEEGNEASIRLLQKSGFQFEGTMRDCEIKFGKYISLLIYSCIFPQEPGEPASE
jgi:ribosomal-protein-alanine N-acetyltransferase